jgi:hypothetical protein
MSFGVGVHHTRFDTCYSCPCQAACICLLKLMQNLTALSHGIDAFQQKRRVASYIWGKRTEILARHKAEYGMIITSHLHSIHGSAC